MAFLGQSSKVLPQSPQPPNMIRSVKTNILQSWYRFQSWSFHCCDKQEEEEKKQNKIMTKSNLWREGFILCYTFRLQSIVEGSQGRNLETGTEAETMEECCLLTCSHASLSLFSYTTQDQMSKEWHYLQ